MTNHIHNWTATIRNGLAVLAVVVVSLFWVFESRAEIDEVRNLHVAQITELRQQHVADIQRLETELAHQKTLVEANRTHDRELIAQIFERLDTIIEKIERLEDTN